jgi:hypothetical protein
MAFTITIDLVTIAYVQVVDHSEKIQRSLICESWEVGGYEKCEPFFEADR